MMSEAGKKFSPLRRFLSRSLLSLAVLFFLIGHCLSVFAQVPPTITEVTPKVVPAEGVFKITFSAKITPRSVKIGNLDGSFVSPATDTKTLDVKVPKDIAEGAQPVKIILDETHTLDTAITVSSKVSTAIIDIDRAVVQPGGNIFLTFNKQVKPSSVRIGIGNAEAGFVAQQQTHRLEVALPTTVTPGRQQITVTIPGENEPTVGAIMVAPRILGLRANKNADLQFSRVVVAGGEFIVQFSDKLPLNLKESLNLRLVNLTAPPKTSTASESKPDLCSEGEKLNSIIPEDQYLIVKAPNYYDWSENTYVLRVCVNNTPLDTDIRLKIQNTYWLYAIALGWVLFLLALVYVLYRIGRKVKEKLQQGQQPQRYWFLKMLLIEPENQTYSLSRTQFLGWLFVIAWCYVFLIYVHGFVEESWGFPNLGNSIYAFLISLGTLVGAQATNRGMGVKGAGEEHPSLADLVVHGGVIALDRVQQIVWTVIALGLFVRITVSTFSTATQLPEIPTEMLALMGLSSVGYLGGKLVRGPGPVIDQVTVPSGTTVLNIKGKHLSKTAFVWLDGEQIEAVVTSKVDDPDDPLKFAKELEVPLPISIEDWNAKDHAITVINSDAQRADIRIKAFPEPEITEVTPGAPDANGNVTVAIECTGVAVGAKIAIATDPSFQPVQNGANPNLFTVQVPSAWTTQAHQLLLESNGKVSSFTYPPSA